MKISATQYAKTLFAITDGKTETEVVEIVKKFVGILQKKGQFKNQARIIEKFSQLWNKKYEITEAEVVSREKIGEDVMAHVMTYVRNKYKTKEVVLKNIVNKDIKGGIIIRVGDEVSDLSVSRKLKELKKVLAS